MVTLSLFRHAKSSWDNPGLADFDRPLAPRGEKAAPRMGKYMAEHGLEPDLVLCSTAVRARQTVDLAASQWASSPPIVHEDGLYHAGSGEMLRLLTSVPEERVHAMLVGHNPGLQALAASIAGSGERPALDAMRAKFPTAALAVIDFDGGWRNAGTGAGRLRLFVVPRDV